MSPFALELTEKLREHDGYRFSEGCVVPASRTRGGSILRRTQPAPPLAVPARQRTGHTQSIRVYPGVLGPDFLSTAVALDTWEALVGLDSKSIQSRLPISNWHRPFLADVVRGRADFPATKLEVAGQYLVSLQQPKANWGTGRP